MQCILWHPSLLLVIQSVQNKFIMFSWGEEGGGGLPGVDTGFFSIGGGYRIFSLGGGYQGWIRDFSIGGGGYQGWIRDFSIGGGYRIFSLGGGYQGWIRDFSIGGGGGGGYQGWIRDFSIGGWEVMKPSGSKNDYNNVYLEVP